MNGDDSTYDASPGASPHVGLDTMRTGEHHGGESSHVQTPLGESNAVEQLPHASSYREQIWLEGKVFNTQGVGKMIVRIFKGMYHGPWATWVDVDNDSRKRMFERFSNLYTWHPDIHELIYEAWENHIQARIYDIMSEARSQAQTEARRAGLVFMTMIYLSLFLITEHR